MHSRVTFELDGEQYTFTDEIKEYFLSRLEPSTYTLEARFDGTRLIHKYIDGDGERVEYELDVVAVFETYPSQAREVLDEIGVKPIRMSIESGTVDLIDWR